MKAFTNALAKFTFMILTVVSILLIGLGYVLLFHREWLVQILCNVFSSMMIVAGIVGLIYGVILGVQYLIITAKCTKNTEK